MTNKTKPNDIVLGGFTKREYFAIQILAGLAANSQTMDFQENPEAVAVEMADKLIQELNEKP